MANETTPLRQQPQQIPKDETITPTPGICDDVLDFLQTNSFVILAAIAIGLAKLYPPLGAVYLCPQITATWLAVIFIFAMAGLSLPSSEFAKAATRLWFNIFVLTFNFGVVSMLVYAMTIGIRYFNLLPQGLTDGMMVCACMPVTVTMVIVLTKSAHGDEAAAVLLAAVGSLLGVVVTPALLWSFIGVQSDISFWQVFLELVLRVVVLRLVVVLLSRRKRTTRKKATTQKNGKANKHRQLLSSFPTAHWRRRKTYWRH